MLYYKCCVHAIPYWDDHGVDIIGDITIQDQYWGHYPYLHVVEMQASIKVYVENLI